jgi:dynein heavy chain
MVERDVSVLSDFLWQKQIRYYIEEATSDECLVRQVNAEIKYGNEYLGATSRLVITPLTDRCWMTITGAL